MPRRFHLFDAYESFIRGLLRSCGAILRGRGFVTVEDIKAVVYKVLRHRLILTYEAEAENLKQDDMIKEILAAIEVTG